MADIFLKLLNMSISASWIVLAVIILRFILKKAPKWINCILWSIVGLRLVMPFSLESIFSLIPSTETISPDIMMQQTPHINSGVPVINSTLNPVIGETFAPNVGDSANPLQIIFPILSVIWLSGIVVLLVYTVISYVKLKKKIGTAVLLRDNIYQSEHVSSPFVLGIIKPKIYLPFNMSEDNTQNVIAHEQAHIRRKDHLWKPLGFLLLTVYWFNPVMWLSYILLCRDIEIACDEKVVKNFTNEQKADYSEALLACSVTRRIIAACPLAFGEVGVKNRVKSVLNYKKPAFWVIVVAVIASIVTAVCFLTSPKTTPKEYYDPGCSLQVTVETFKGTTQLPNKTETFIFDVFNGTEGNLPNGTIFKITECNLQDGSVTIKLTGEQLFTSEGATQKQAKEIVVYEGTDGIQLTDENYMHFITFSFVLTESLDEAVSKAILEDNKGGYYELGTECATEGHIIYGVDVEENKYTVYTLTTYNNFGFMNGYFIPQSGGKILAVMTFEKTSEGYNLLDVKYPKDGAYYVDSVKELFPEKYHYRVLNPTLSDDNNLWKQCTSYAKAYLDSIGRSEKISKYSELEITLLTDMGVSVEVSNKILEYNLPYDSAPGYFEALENSVRYIYRTQYDKSKNLVIFTKEKYDTKEIVEKIEIDSLTGDIVTSEKENVPSPKKIQSIVDKTDTEAIATATALEWFYFDGTYNYYFPSIRSEYVIVTFTDSTQKTVKDALADGEITMKDLDEYKIMYYTEFRQYENSYFNAEVLEVNGKNILVKPDEASNERKSADKIYVSLDVTSNIPVPAIKVGDRVRIIYNGELLESYPAQINKVFVIYLLSENGDVLSPTPSKK